MQRQIHRAPGSPILIAKSRQKPLKTSRRGQGQVSDHSSMCLYEYGSGVGAPADYLLVDRSVRYHAEMQAQQQVPYIRTAAPWAHTVPGPGARGRSGSGAGRSPERWFYDFEAILKQSLHTTRPAASRWKALVETCQKTIRKGMSAVCRLRARRREWARGRVMLRGVELGRAGVRARGRARASVRGVRRSRGRGKGRVRVGTGPRGAPVG